VWSDLASVGVDMDDVAEQLERDGVASFQKSFDELIAALTAKSDTL
jgi:transaldolase